MTHSAAVTQAGTSNGNTTATVARVAGPSHPEALLNDSIPVLKRPWYAQRRTSGAGEDDQSAFQLENSVK
jgi:hypothetical protein